MIRSATTIPSSSSFVLEPSDVRRLNCPRSVVVARRVRFSKICALRNYDSIPKRSGFDRNSIDRIYEDLPFIQKIEKELTDYCLTLEGDPCYYCWRALSELSDLQRELPKEELERVLMVVGGDGLQSMIKNLHSTSLYYKRLKKEKESKGSATNALNEEKKKENSGSTTKALNEEKTKEEPKHVPEWMPKTIEELEEEEKDRMPDTPHGRLLRAMRVYPAWYKTRPDHESD